MKLGEITQPMVAVLADAHEAELLLEQDSSQFNRRAFVRSYMSAVEAMVWIIKQMCLGAKTTSGRDHLSVAEKAILLEQTYDVDSKGEVRIGSKFIRTTDNVRFTAELCNRLFRSRMDLQIGGRFWQQFKRAIELRNRITHPKLATDLNVGDAEIAEFLVMQSHLNTQFAHLMVHVSTIAENDRESEQADREAGPNESR